MAKATATQNKDLNPKTLSTPKDGFIQKKKSQKFKQTPKGKIPLINGSKASNNNNIKQQQLQKQKNSLPEKFSEKNKGLKKVNSPKTDKKQSPKKELSKKGLNKSKANEFDSDEDINEGVVLKEEELMEETDDTDSEVESDEDVQDKKVLDVLGTSLADDTEEDDEEFKIEDKKGKAQVNKGVKMFKGVKSSNKSSDKSSTENSLVDDEDDEDDDDDDEMEDDGSEDVEEEEDDDDEEEEDDEEEDEEEEEESENEGEESVLGTKALLSQSLADDDDDEDFVEPEGHEEDDDISDEDEEEGEADNSTLDNSYQSNSSKDSSYEKTKADNNTIFVGNLPKEVTYKQLRKLFKKFGNIDTIRIRGIVPDSPQIPKKVAAITKKLHPKLQTVYAYVRFVSEESAKAALALNGTLFEGNHLRVDTANKTEKKYDAKKSVFLGNLPFKIDHETVRKHFQSCGEIESVHVVRDNITGIGKGIGYVNFKTEDAVALAFELNGTTILNREVIVKPYVEHHQGKYRKRSHSRESDKQGSPRKQFKQNSGKSSSAPNKESPKKVGKEQKVGKKQASPQQKSMFQGQKADKDKKKKENKVDKKKKILAEKLTAKPKKPSN